MKVLIKGLPDARRGPKTPFNALYVGKVCLRHPELGGQRRRSNSHCPQCVRDRMKRQRLNDPLTFNRKKLRERHRRQRMKEAGVWVDLRKKKAPDVVSARGKSAEGVRRSGRYANVE